MRLLDIIDCKLIKLEVEECATSGPVTYKLTGTSALQIQAEFIALVLAIQTRRSPWFLMLNDKRTSYITIFGRLDAIEVVTDPDELDAGFISPNEPF